MVAEARIPTGLEWWRDEPGGAEWLERLPTLVAECVSEWELDPGPPFEPAHISYVAPATLADGTRAVLKINFPEPESEHEAAALEHWNGNGAVTLLAGDQERRALLTEHCAPGGHLWRMDEDDATSMAADVLRRLWRPAPDRYPFRLLADEARRWREEIPAEWEVCGRPFERPLVDEVVGFLRDAGPSQGKAFVLHGDFHGGNVLQASRGWLAIDPKPLVGEREFDPGWLLSDRLEELKRNPDPVRRVRRRLDRLSSELGLDRERIRGWGIAHVLAWGAWKGTFDADAVTCARWLSES